MFENHYNINSSMSRKFGKTRVIRENTVVPDCFSIDIDVGTIKLCVTLN